MLEIAINIKDGIRVAVEGITYANMLSFGGLIAIICCSLAVSLAFYLLRSIGLFVLAKKNGVKHAFLAWIPCAWIYVACMLIADSRFFGLSFKSIALAALIVFALEGVLNAVYYSLNYIPVIGYISQGGTVTFVEESGLLRISVGDDFLNPYSDYNAVKVATNVIYYVNNVISLVTMVLTVFVYISLFRKFWPQHYVLAAVLSFMGFFPVFVFAVRNKPAMNYADYLRSRYYGDYYGQTPPPNTERPPEHPFEEFAGRGEKDPGDPFSDFSSDRPYGKDEDDKDE